MICQECKGKKILELSETALGKTPFKVGLTCGVCAGTGKARFWLFIQQLLKEISVGKEKLNASNT